MLHYCFFSFFLLSVLLPDVETAGRLTGWTTTLPLAPHCRVNLSGFRGVPDSSLSRDRMSLVSCLIWWPTAPIVFAVRCFSLSSLSLWTCNLSTSSWSPVMASNLRLRQFWAASLFLPRLRMSLRRVTCSGEKPWPSRTSRNSSTGMLTICRTENGRHIARARSSSRLSSPSSSRNPSSSLRGSSLMFLRGSVTDGWLKKLADE